MKRSRKIGISQILIGILVILACINLAVLFFFPSRLADWFHREQLSAVTAPVQDEGAGKAELTVETESRTFDGNGIFDPLSGVSALDEDGSDITKKVAANFVSGKRIDQKTIRYMVFTSGGERLEAECRLELEDYSGPSIEVAELSSVKWEDLQEFPRLLVERDMLHGSDGFGNDISGQVGCFYQIDPEKQTAELTFSLYNSFMDYCSTKVIVLVDDLPLDYEGIPTM